MSTSWRGDGRVGVHEVARLMSRLGPDPAFGSGPLATVIQDVLSLLMYLLIATAMLS